MKKSNLTLPVVLVAFTAITGCARWRDDSVGQPLTVVVTPDASNGGTGGSGGTEADAGPDASNGGTGGSGGTEADAGPDASNGGAGGMEADSGPQPECSAAADCNDGNVCTRDACVGGSCSHEHTNMSCDDGNPATTDICADPTADDPCLHIPTEQPAGCTPVDDNDACTEDLCDADGNTVHPPKDCGDGDPSTADTCDAAGACQHTSICGDGTAYDPGQGKCVPFFVAHCVQGTHACQQFDEQVADAVCLNDRWLEVQVCGAIAAANAVCVDGEGCQATP